MGISERTGPKAFLARLRRDVGGNTLMLVAASLIPLMGLVGGSIDLSRLYLARVRLQHACDAGALAGRKAMGAGTWAATVPSPKGVADQFFAGNFKAGSYATTDLGHKWEEHSGVVSGTAWVTVPMAVMSFFDVQPLALNVTCSAQMQIPNIDVMFVLDNTGSMAQKANPSDPDNKITTLKYAVKCFYESVMQLTTNAGCPAGTSTGKGITTSAQIRFGFVPYNTNVNVGRLLPSSYFANSWPYQSRTPRVWVWQSASSAKVPAASCKNAPSQTDTPSGDDIGSTLTRVASTIDPGGSNCTQTTTKFVLKEGVSPGPKDEFKEWRYAQISQDVTSLKNGNGWKSGVTLPIGENGAPATLKWDGCIEERATVRTTDYNPIPPEAHDLDIDSKPDQNVATSLWGPAIPGTIYPRPQPGNWNLAEVRSNSKSYANSGFAYSCPAAAAKMQVWNSTDFQNYVDDLQPGGNTYHDIGMIWGGRLMSPKGIFDTENAQTPQGGEISRYMIFMTDGDTVTTNGNYNAYGLAWFDRRQTPANVVPDGQMLDQQVNLRFAALCERVKKEEINIFVISFGGNGIAADTKQRLQACATDDSHYYDATNAAQLKSAFQSIAAQITQLRLVK